MCLVLEKRQRKIKWDKNGEATLWKVYKKCIYTSAPIKDHYLESEWQGMCVDKPGQVISNRDNKGLYPTEDSKIECGIHVFLTKPDRRYSYIVVPVRCRKSDLVATGVDNGDQRCPSAVFMKVLLDKKTWKRIFGD